MAMRVRFAPSPTGHVHIGNIRVAIFNWLFARHADAKFLLRIEDTDRERCTPEAVRALFDAMEWLGLTYDEEPLYQSSRVQAHLEAAELLLSKGAAYKEDKGGTGQGECIVFRMPKENCSFHDQVRGELRKEAKDLQDFVIVRSNGTPVFHLANVSDDIHMNITHVMRGDDHIENTFKHIALFRALGADVPQYAHFPMIVNGQGKPYSKRDGAAFVGEYREQGFLPDALFNFLALLGWSPGDDREVMTRQELIQLFDLARVKSAPAQLDPAKLEWMNGEYVRQMPKDVFIPRFRKSLDAGGLNLAATPEDYLLRVAGLMQDRTKKFSDIARDSGFFFTENFTCDEKAAAKRLFHAPVPALLRAAAARFAALEAFTAASAEAAVRTLAEEQGGSASILIHPIRVAVSGLAYGPGLFEMLELLGRDRVLSRLEQSALKVEQKLKGT